MTLINIDENRWPIVIITLSGKETKKDIQEFLGKLEIFRDREEAFCFVLDLREINRLAPEAREILIDGLKSTDLHELAGTALVLSSSVMRMYLSAVLWLTKIQSHHKARFRHKTVVSLHEAYEWSRRCLHIKRPGSLRRVELP